jgi:hypothetical protein
VAEKIHYLLFRDQGAVTIGEDRLRAIGDLRIHADEDDEGRYWLVAISTTVDRSPSSEEMEALAAELGGEYDGSETELAE